ncbi:MAG: hypothetical protein QM638_21000 [Nocardioides sp.]|uniref:hypothetical protein n=1 Tax=Nocardioides sp. TaxID=35761 RepID=UPI0039E5CFBA
MRREETADSVGEDGERRVLPAGSGLSRRLRATARGGRDRVRRALRRCSGREATDQIVRVRARVDGLTERAQVSVQQSAKAARDAEFSSREVNRLAPQLAALETKVERLRLALDQLAPDAATDPAAPAAAVTDPAADPTAPDPTALSQARGLVATIQDEHRRIRVRLSALTRYEERLRRIEAQLGLPHE